MALKTDVGHLDRYATSLDAEGQESSYDPEFEALIKRMLLHVGEDPDRDGLKRTPLRVAKAMHFLTGGFRLSSVQLRDASRRRVDCWRVKDSAPL